MWHHTNHLIITRCCSSLIELKYGNGECIYYQGSEASVTWKPSLSSILRPFFLLTYMYMLFSFHSLYCKFFQCLLPHVLPVSSLIARSAPLNFCTPTIDISANTVSNLFQWKLFVPLFHKVTIRPTTTKVVPSNFILVCECHLLPRFRYKIFSPAPSRIICTASRPSYFVLILSLYIFPLLCSSSCACAHVQVCSMSSFSFFSSVQLNVYFRMLKVHFSCYILTFCPLLLHQSSPTKLTKTFSLCNAPNCYSAFILLEISTTFDKNLLLLKLSPKFLVAFYFWISVGVFSHLFSMWIFWLSGTYIEKENMLSFPLLSALSKFTSKCRYYCF